MRSVTDKQDTESQIRLFRSDQSTRTGSLDRGSSNRGDPVWQQLPRSGPPRRGRGLAHAGGDADGRVLPGADCPRALHLADTVRVRRRARHECEHFPVGLGAGPQGAIIAASAGLVVSAALHVALMVRSGGIDFGIAIVRPGVCAALAVGVYWGLATIAPWPALLAALVVFGVGMVVLGGLRRSERGALRTALLRPLRLLPARGRS